VRIEVLVGVYLPVFFSYTNIVGVLGLLDLMQVRLIVQFSHIGDLNQELLILGLVLA